MQWNKTTRPWRVQFGNDPFTIDVQAHSKSSAIVEARARYNRFTDFRGRDLEAKAWELEEAA